MFRSKKKRNSNHFLKGKKRLELFRGSVQYVKKEDTWQKEERDVHHREGTAKDLSTNFPAEMGSRFLTAFLLLLIRSSFSRVNGWNSRGPTSSHYLF